MKHFHSEHYAIIVSQKSTLSLRTYQHSTGPDLAGGRPGAHGERGEREPTTGVWGQCPQRGPGAEPLVRGAKPPWSWKPFSFWCPMEAAICFILHILQTPWIPGNCDTCQKKTEGIVHDGMYSTYINRKAVWNCSACDMREISRDARIVEFLRTSVRMAYRLASYLWSSNLTVTQFCL